MAQDEHTIESKSKEEKSEDSGLDTTSTTPTSERARIVCKLTKCRKISAYSVAIVFLTVGCLITGFWWHLYNGLVLKQLPLSNTSESETFATWTNGEFPLYLRMYMFNWTNPEETLADKAKPNFQQVGPYVYRLEMYRKNFVWNSNDTLTYLTGQRFYFEPKLSECNPYTDVITSPNVVLITLVRHLNTVPKFIKVAINALFKQYQISPHIKKTVSELLFDGYEDRLLELIKPFRKYIPSLKTLPDRFGWYRPKNTTLADIFNMYTGQKDLSKLGTLYARNYSTNIDGFSGSCAKVQGSTGDFWPTDITQSENAFLFISDFCSAFQLQKQEAQVVNDIKGIRFEGAEATFDNGTRCPKNSCYCPDNKCRWRSGVRDVSSCVQAPLFVSFPHFYAADPSYVEEVDGLKPNRSLHSFQMIFQTDYGIVLSGAARLQINVHLEPVPGLGIFENVRDMLIPALWFEEVIELPATMLNKLHLSFTIVPLVFSVTGLILVILGSIIVVFTVIVTRLTEESIPYVNDQL